MSIHKKEKDIRLLVEYFLAKYGGKILIKDYWEADRLAIGFTEISSRYLVYVSTNNQKKDSYFVAVENPSIDQTIPYEPSSVFENLSLEELEKIIIEHLKINR